MVIKILKSTIQIKNEIYFVVFNYMIADMLSNKKPNWIVAKLFRKQNISIVFMRDLSSSCFAVPESIRLSSTGYLHITHIIISISTNRI